MNKISLERKTNENLLILTEMYYKGGVDTFIENIIKGLEIKNTAIAVNNNHPGIGEYEKKLGINKNSLIIYKPLKQYIQGFFKAINSKGIWINRFTYILSLFYEYSVGLIEYLIISKDIYNKSKEKLGNNFAILIVNGGYPASLLCRLFTIIISIFNKDIRVIFTVHSCSEKSLPIFFLQDLLIENLINRTVSKFIFVSQASLKSFRQTRNIMNYKKVSYIYNWIEDPINKYKNISLYCDIDKDRKKKVFKIVSLGTYTLYKGHLTVFKSIKRLVDEGKKLEYNLCGYGTSQEYMYLKTKIILLGLEKQIKILKFQNPEDVIINADLLVLASQKYEAFGLCLLDAMSMGIPAIGSNIGGIKEVLSHSPHLLFNANDHIGLAEIINQFYISKAKCNNEGILAREHYSKNFNGKDSIERYKSLLFRND